MGISGEFRALWYNFFTCRTLRPNWALLKRQEWECGHVTYRNKHKKQIIAKRLESRFLVC